jgi:hypothetical protein
MLGVYAALSEAQEGMGMPLLLIARMRRRRKVEECGT